ncbi:MAG: hypothetical protein M1819_003321 [Sarea resinae]|nr:MAG: hypothetical protein M1819_003321 [Sarea resinae]
MARPRRESDRPHGAKRASGAGGGHRPPRRERETREGRSPATTPKRASKASSSSPSKTSSQTLSMQTLAQLDAHNEKLAFKERERQRAQEKAAFAAEEKLRTKERERLRAQEKRAFIENEKLRTKERSRERIVTGRVVKHRSEQKRKRRVVSGPILEEGGDEMARRDESRKGPKLWFWIVLGVIALILIIVIPVAVVVGGKKHKSSGTDPSSPASAATTTPANSNLNGVTVPASAKGTYLDPFTWYDTTDFNVTYTAATVGGLSVMGLNSTWDDTTKAQSGTPPLNQKWTYSTSQPIRGVNVGGWLSIEPFITPSLFNYESNLNIVDEYTLCEHLGSAQAAKTLERHYASFITKQTFADIQSAGFDHVRIPFSYWAVTTYPGDPYVAQISWRYLLRGIEYARQYGLRVNLDLHGLPGSQNGWNHSGRQGYIGWLNGTDGDLNAQRSLDIHNQLSQFFAQPRYKNIVTIYGLVNEPRMTALPVDNVLNWTTSAIDIVRKNGVDAIISFGDGFMGLQNWKGKLQGIDNLVLDVHQYVIFNVDQIAFDHQDKVKFACSGWTGQMKQSMNTATGFGPTICGEWSQADTDCATNLNNVNVGSRWAGTMNLQPPSTGGSVLTPSCPANSGTCECSDANADPSKYSTIYKQWLQMFAEAQMASYETGWGWFYWTWITEESVQWSWKLGLAAGILPQKAYAPEFNCTTDVPDYGSKGLPENY